MMTRARVNLSLPPELAEAARRKSEATGIPVSVVVQRALAHWILTGELAPIAESSPAAAAAGQGKRGGTRRKPAK